MGHDRFGDAQLDEGLLRQHLVHVAGENAWQQRARLAQSLWREDHGWDPGSRAQDYVDPTADRLGSRLSSADAEMGSNFLTRRAFDRAEFEVTHKESGALMSRARLQHDLLSSQPLCFSIFAELDNDPDLATRVLQELIPHLRLTGIAGPVLFEHSPGRGEPAYGGDASAFDVAIPYTSELGVGLLAIEVKYHENLAQADRKTPDFTGWFPECELQHAAQLVRPPLVQLARDHRLARAVARNDASNYPAGVTWVLLYPARNSAVSHAIASYRRLMPNARDITPITLEALVAACQRHTTDSWPELLRARYLDTERVCALGVAAQHATQEWPISDDPGEAACWQRWWLATQLHARWYRRLGVEVQGASFEPLDGDLYSLPVWSPSCRVAPRYFGRLSGGVVHLDPSHAQELGVPPASHQPADLDLPRGQSRRLVDDVQSFLGLARQPGHEACPHAGESVDYPTAWLVALLVRTRGLTVVHSDRQLVQVSAQHPQLVPLIEYHRQGRLRGDWLVVFGPGGRIISASHPAGVTITPTIALNHRHLSRSVPLVRIAQEIDPTLDARH